MLDYIRYPDWIQPEIIPGLPFRWYGLMYLLAFATSYAIFVYQIRSRKLEVAQETILNFFFWGIVGLLIGARLFATLLFDPTHTYLRQPWLIFWPFDQHMRFVGLQGMNYYGGVLGAVVGFAIFSARRGINLLDWGDMLVSGIPLGYTFGRLGNFINAELYGRVTTAPWGMIFPTAPGFPANQQWVLETAKRAGLDAQANTVHGMINLPRHPTQIYEGVLEGIVLWLLIWFVFRKKKPYDGFIIGIYIIGYGVARFFLDYFRLPLDTDHFAIQLVHIDNPPYFLLTPFNFTNSQIASFAMVVVGVAYLIVLPRILEHRKRRVAEAAAARDERKKSVRKFRKRQK